MRERVHLIGRSDGQPMSLIAFRAGLRVNTDGAPISYHPDDLRGRVKAINNICNGVSVRDMAGRRLGCGEARAAFAAFRDRNWVEPPGVTIRWQNVIAARSEGGRSIPCVFRSGPHAGYLGSLTTLKNGLAPAERGECEAADQVDQSQIPTIVLPGGANPLRQFGARIGDLVAVRNPETGVDVAAIIADAGPPDNLGEGSVALNMRLLGAPRPPATYGEALQLDTGPKQMIVVIVPDSRGFQPQRPFTAANLEQRIGAYAASKGLPGNLKALLDFASACAPN
ncbi:hypothetical protein [Rhabdaerophilum calidifontis]|uniref:hypothetical protein n=1 Tax=Rhabdaerophilum calidifontis TaxID=2604328 RepID=UPI0012392BA0|nr:hypothetical protein [Rhabdaerophilum calidifontis]